MAVLQREVKQLTKRGRSADKVGAVRVWLLAGGAELERAVDEFGGQEGLRATMKRSLCWACWECAGSTF